MASTRYFEGFIDNHPDYFVNCDICDSDIAMFTDIETFENICLDCCDDIWFARAEIRTVDLILQKWGNKQ